MQKQIRANRINTILIIIGFILVITVFGALATALTSDPAYVIVIFAAATIYALLQYFLADKLSTFMSSAHPVSASEQPKVYHQINNLANAAHIPMPKIYMIDDPAPNAYAIGRDPKKARIVLTSGLVNIMPDAELKAVIGHEISHIKNYDIRISMLVYGLVSIIGIFSDLGFRLLYFGSFRRSGDSDERSPIGVIALVFAIILAPIAASIAQMAVSREREYLADASSAKLLGSPDAMISALEKLAEHSRPMHQQNVATEALFITSPIRKSLFSSLFSTHPPLEKRIERLKGSK